MLHASLPRARRLRALLLLIVFPLLTLLTGPSPAGARLASVPTPWQAVPLPPAVAPADVMGLAVHPDSAARAFLATASAVYTTTDAGDHWTPVTSLITPTGALTPTTPISITALTVAPGDGQRVYGWGSDLARSDDGGGSWARLPPAPAALCELLVAPDDAGQIYGRSCAGDPALYRSDDGGQGWSTAAPTATLRFRSLVVLPGGTLLGADEQAVYRSADAGRLWTAAPIGTTVVSASLVVDRLDGTVYLGAAEGLLRSSDGGSTWQNADLARALPLLVVAPFAPHTVLGGMPSSLWTISTRDPSWSVTPTTLPGQPQWFARSAHDPTLLYALTDTGLWRLPTSALPPALTERLYLPLLVGALAGAGTPSGTDAEQALAYANSARVRSGAPPLQLHPALVTAAQHHAHYDVLNYADATAWLYGPHGEVAGKPGFTGQTPRDRGSATGYPWLSFGNGEVIAYLYAPSQSVEVWLGTVFHRTGVLNPRYHAAGYARERNAIELVDVLDLWGGPTDSGVWSRAQPFVITYPVDGQNEVPLEGDSEIPSPVPPGTTYPIGYPVTVQVGRGSVLNVSLAELRDAQGQLVAVHPNPAGCAAACYALIPVSSLRPAERYTAHIVGAVDGVPFDQIWHFTTTACMTPGFC